MINKSTKGIYFPMKTNLYKEKYIMTDANTPEVPESAENSGETPQINLVPQDLGMYATIIKAAMERGAFKAEEYSQVGTSYDKLVAFLKQIAPPAEEGATEGSAEEGSSTDAEGDNTDNVE